MSGILRCQLLIFSAMLLAVAEDGSQALLDSPWVKHASVSILPERGEGQLRDGGKMGGGGKRAGLAKVKTPPGTLDVRWESAAPIRTAESKAADTPGPRWDGDYYAIAVYGVPGITPGNERGLRSELKQSSFLRRRGKKDLKPARVDVAVLADHSARILYLFPRSAAITPEDRRVEFVSQIGRFVVAPWFNLADMTYQGKLEL